MTALPPRLRFLAQTGAGARLGTHRPAWRAPPKCREIATCVRDPAPGELPRGRRNCNTGPRCQRSLPAVHGSLAGRTVEWKKIFCCVTTRRRNVWAGGCLRRRLDSLAAHALGLGMLGFTHRAGSSLGLPPRCLPTTDLPQTLRRLAVALVPALRPIPAATPFPQADPNPRPPPSGSAAVPRLTLVGAHGRLFSQGKARGERANALLGRLSIREANDTHRHAASLKSRQGTRQRKRLLEKFISEEDETSPRLAFSQRAKLALN